MKKYFNAMLACMAMLMTVGFVSCDKDDDDVTGEKHPAAQEVNVYGVCLTDYVFDYYDITLVLHSGDKSKEVTLKKSDCVSETFAHETIKTNLYAVEYGSVDGSIGIDRVEAKVAPKSNIEQLLKALPEGTPLVVVRTAVMAKAKVLPNGGYESLNRTTNLNAGITRPEKLLGVTRDGKLGYVMDAEITKTYLSKERH